MKEMSSEKTITDQILKLSLVDFNHLSHAAPVPNRPPPMLTESAIEAFVIKLLERKG